MRLLGRLRARVLAPWSGEPDRPIMLHGPVVRAIIAGQAVATAVATAAFIVTILLFSGRVDRATERADINAARIQAVQDSRPAAVYDFCRVLQTLTRAASAQQGKAAQGELFLRKVGLDDCRTFAFQSTRIAPGPGRVPGR